MKVSVLFVESNSIYKDLGFDCWDKARDARKWCGGSTVVAHPPCRGYGSLKQFANVEPGELALAHFAIDAVRKWGGVLEHPERSTLWPAVLPVPGKRDAWGGFTLSVDQHWFGHPAQKRTFLCIVGCEPSEIPSLPLNFGAIERCIAPGRKKRQQGRALKQVSHKWRHATPINFAMWLTELAVICGQKKGVL